MPRNNIQEIDEKIMELQSNGEEYRLLSNKASLTKQCLTMQGDGSGVWNIWSVIPSRCPDWLWDMLRNGDNNLPLDDWGVSFVNDSLTIIGGDVRFDVNGKPSSQLIFYRSQLRSYTDDEKLMKWANSSPERAKLVSAEIQDGAGSTIAAAREAFYGERLWIFYNVFTSLVAAPDNVAPLRPIYEDNAMQNDTD